MFSVLVPARYLMVGDPNPGFEVSLGRESEWLANTQDEVDVYILEGLSEIGTFYDVAPRTLGASGT